jgi:uncharacterized protein DUF6545
MDRGVDRAVRAALADAPVPFDVRAYATQLAARRGRPIDLVGRHLAGTGPSGVLVTTATGDRIVYDTATTPLHIRHTLAHELAHLALGHTHDQRDHQDGRGQGPVPAPLSADLLRRLVPDLPTALITRILGRTAHAQTEEHQAELLATLLNTEAELSPGPLPSPSRRALGPARPRWWRQATARRLHTALDPLWSALPHGAVDGLTLTALGPVSPDLALYRRVIEIRDALLLLRPYAHPSAHTWAHQAARDALLSPGRTAVMVDAAVLATAIDAYTARQSPHTAPGPAPLGIPAPDLRSEAHALLRLAAALSHPIVTGVARHARLTPPVTTLVPCPRSGHC